MRAIGRARIVSIYIGLAVLLIVPLVVAANSPLLQWRQPIYIMAGLAGVIGLCLLLLQALLAADALPALARNRARALHRWFGVALILAVVLHVIGLWFTSPPDVLDALLLRSPTAFSVWGVAAMWAVTGASLMAGLRNRVVRRSGGGQQGLRIWRWGHTTLAVLAVVGTVIHALLIEGTMGLLSKWMLCLLVAAAVAWLLVRQLTGNSK